MNIWTEFAKSYDEVIPRLHCYKGMTEKALGFLAPAKRVLDAGCGTGILSQRLVAMGCQVVGFDNNPAMLSRAFERRETSSFSDWQIFEASLEQTPALSIGFDGILLNNVLFYVKNIDTVLEWLAKLLLPGGRMVITGPWQRPDLGVVMSQSIRQWQDCGEWDEELQQSFDRFVRVSQKLVSDSSEMQTFFRAEELIGRLRDHFELKVLSSSETDYFGQNFFVAVERI